MEKLRKVLKLLNPDRPQSEAELSVEINKQDQDHEAFLGRTGKDSHVLTRITLRQRATKAVATKR